MTKSIIVWGLMALTLIAAMGILPSSGTSQANAATNPGAHHSYAATTGAPALPQENPAAADLGTLTGQMQGATPLSIYAFNGIIRSALMYLGIPFGYGRPGACLLMTLLVQQINFRALNDPFVFLNKAAWLAEVDFTRGDIPCPGYVNSPRGDQSSR